MREYGKLKTAFWRNPKIRSLSEPARLLACYLISCPHGNALGCFIVPDGYIADDLGWVAKTVRERLGELYGIGFCERDDNTCLLRLMSWWEHNTIENPNVGKRIMAELKLLPSCAVKRNLIRSIEPFAKKYTTVSEGLKAFSLPEPKPEPKPEPEPEPKTLVPAKVRASVCDASFDEFWQVYPRRIAKGAAAVAYRKALAKTTPEVLLAASRRFASERSGQDPRYIPHAATWLNGERWLDDPPPDSFHPNGRKTAPQEAIYAGFAIALGDAERQADRGEDQHPVEPVLDTGYLPGNSGASSA